MKDGSDIVGNRTLVKVVKNKIAPPFRRAEFDIIYGEGISGLGELVDLAVENDIIAKSGSWYAYGDTKIGQGREAAKRWLAENESYLRFQKKEYHLYKYAMVLLSGNLLHFQKRVADNHHHWYPQSLFPLVIHICIHLEAFPSPGKLNISYLP